MVGPLIPHCCYISMMSYQLGDLTSHTGPAHQLLPMLRPLLHPLVSSPPLLMEWSPLLRGHSHWSTLYCPGQGLVMGDITLYSPGQGLVMGDITLYSPGQGLVIGTLLYIAQVRGW